MAVINRIYETFPVPSYMRRRIWHMVVGAVLFFTVSLTDGFLTGGYDPWQQSISALSLGPHGWVQVLNFYLFGSIVLGTATTWKRLLAGRKSATAISVLAVITGLSLILCGIFKQDPAPGYDPQGLALTAPTLTGLLHLLFAAIGALSSIASLLILSRCFDNDPYWPGWNVYTTMMALIMAACITFYAVFSTDATGFAGLFERLGLMTVPVWVLSFLIRLEKGVPFMRKV